MNRRDIIHPGSGIRLEINLSPLGNGKDDVWASGVGRGGISTA